MTLQAMLFAHLERHAEIVAVTEGLSREEWLALRATGVGASDAAAVAGVSHWQSPYALWLERRGLVPPRPASPVMSFGEFCEPLIYARYHEATGRRAEKANVLVRSTAEPFMLCTPDAVTVDDGELGLIEAKTVGHWQTGEWGPDVAPLEYVVQAMHQLIVTQVGFVDLVPLMLDTRDLGDPVRIRYDEAIAGVLVDRERAWWQLVQEGTPPPVDGSASTAAGLKERWARSVDDHTAELDIVMHDRWLRLVEIRAARRVLEVEAEELENHLRAALGDAARATYGGEPVINARTTEQRRIDVDRLRAEEPGIAERFTVTSPVRQLRRAHKPRGKKKKGDGGVNES